VTLVAGALDEKFVAEARAMAQRIDGAKVIVVPGVGHDVVLERPAAVIGVLNGENA
jgi:pimeloyl-ACP methyl ester carboxylesterase